MILQPRRCCMIGRSVRSGSKRGLVAVALAMGVGLASVSSCGDSGTNPPPGSERGVIEATVTADGAVRSGVAVRLFASGGSTAIETRQTTGSGVAEFGALDAGTYEVEVEVPAGLEPDVGQTLRRGVAVQAGGRSQVAFELVSEGDPTGSVVEIHLTAGFQFDPSTVTISVGTTVRWINDSNTFHTVTPRDHSEWSRVELSTAGQTFEHTFETAGTFDFFCEPHESTMTGSITVQ
jgi:plastocyanin